MPSTIQPNHNSKIRKNSITQYQVLRPKKSFPTRVKDAITTLLGQQYGVSPTGFGFNQRVVDMRPGQPIQVSKDFLALAMEAYSNNPFFYRGCRIILDSASDIDIDVVQKETGVDDEGKPKTEWNDAPEDHPMQSILEWPSDDQNWHDYQETVMLHLLLIGHSFTHKAKPNNQLTPLRPDLVSIVPGDDGRVDHYEYRQNQQQTKPDIFKPEEIMHLMLIDPVNSLGGISPAQAAAASIFLNNVGREWNKAKLENTVGLGGVFYGEAPLTENQQEQIENNVLEHAGAPNAGKFALLDGVTGFEDLSGTPKEMDWSQSMELSAHEVCMALGIPKELLWGEATYENLDQSMRQLYTRTILPLMGKLIDGLNHWLALDYGADIKFEIDVEDITVLQEDLQTKAEWIMPLVTNRIVTVNEGREKLGWEERPDCDIFLEPSQLMPVQPGESSPQDNAAGGATQPKPNAVSTPAAQNPGVRSPPGTPGVGPTPGNGNGNAPPAKSNAAVMDTLDKMKALVESKS